ncbi:UPF0609 protein [Toxocara canis]|uniref:UPF0609 protein n=1 Tax=Toxocara canis TaxID=6265 RepID=A0A0B2VB87_TOXCA|nr:UPF0609 protein [Toxocara canis]
MLTEWIRLVQVQVAANWKRGVNRLNWLCEPFEPVTRTILTGSVVRRFALRLQMATPLPKCKFGARCYRRKYKKHMEEYSHDGIVFPNDSNSVDNTSDQTKRGAAENNEPQPLKRPKIDISEGKLKEDIEAKFLVAFPSEFFRFWKDVQAIANDNAVSDTCKALISANNLRLVGVFDYMAGNIGEVADGEANVYLTKDRFPTDLPQMQTIAIYDGGRFAYWRDRPSEEEALLVHMKSTDEHFPKVEIVGSRDPTHMIAFLKVCHAEQSSADELLAKLTHPESANETNDTRYDPEGFIEKYNAKVKGLKEKRHELANGNPSHGLGIVISDTYIYRPGYDELKPMLEEIAMEKEPTLERDLKMGFVVDAVDCAKEGLAHKMNIGIALEYGQELFMSNYAEFDALARSMLDAAYGALKLDNFQQILNAHMEVRREAQHSHRGDN